MARSSRWDAPRPNGGGGLRVSLLGRFQVRRGERVVIGLRGSRVQDLFSYLLLHRDHPHSRETLADLLWGESAAEQSRKYLRQALWQLQSELGASRGPAHQRVLLVEPEWVGLNPSADVWLDVHEFERAFGLLQELPPGAPDARRARLLGAAVQLYQGDLLQGCYLDWCLRERERLQSMYLAMLDSLVCYCECHGKYALGLSYAMSMLGCDRASERTHRRLMRLQYLSGDRTAALRQYQRCTSALAEELGVEPSALTRSLYEQIRADQLDPRPLPEGGPVPTPPGDGRATPDMLGSLRRLQSALAAMQAQVEQHISAIGRGRGHHSDG